MIKIPHFFNKKIHAQANPWGKKNLTKWWCWDNEISFGLFLLDANVKAVLWAITVTSHSIWFKYINLLYQELLITHHGGQKVHQRKKNWPFFLRGPSKEINSLAYEQAMCLGSRILHWLIGSRLAGSRRLPRRILSMDPQENPFDGEVAS